jgi:TorA maturation chaperone TorD
MQPTTLECDAREATLGRAVVYRYLSESLRHPAQAFLTEQEWGAPLVAALEACDASALDALAARCRALGEDRTAVESDYGRVIGHTPRAGVPPYESEWLGAAGELLQYHQMADVAAFYRAHGLALHGDCDERVDHVAVELSFLHFLCAKEAWAEEHGDFELARVARVAQQAFLGEHVAPWTPAFFARLRAAAGRGYYPALAELAARWIEAECRRLEVACGDPTRAPGESSITLEDTCVSCAHASSCVPGGAASPTEEPGP